MNLAADMTMLASILIYVVLLAIAAERWSHS